MDLGAVTAVVLDASLADAEIPAADSRLESVLDWLGRVGEIGAAILAVLALFAGARGIYRRTLGRKRDRYARLKRLGTNAQVAFFSSVLGEPPAMRRTIEGSATQLDNRGRRFLDPGGWGGGRSRARPVSPPAHLRDRGARRRRFDF
jgi:hypothetical protein